MDSKGRNSERPNHLTEFLRSRTRTLSRCPAGIGLRSIVKDSHALLFCPFTETYVSLAAQTRLANSRTRTFAVRVLIDKLYALIQITSIGQFLKRPARGKERARVSLILFSFHFDVRERGGLRRIEFSLRVPRGYGIPILNRSLMCA